MQRTCDICRPSSKSYVVFLKNRVISEKLSIYFDDQTDWEHISSNLYLLNEKSFYDLMDYAEAHLADEEVLASNAPSSFVDKLKRSEMRPILSFKQERESGWVDEIIEQRRLVTHFQPIIEKSSEDVQIIGHELLSRGLDQDGKLIPPFQLFEAARARNRLFALDRICRMEGIKNSASLKNCMLFLNFIPTAIYVPEHCLSTTFRLIQALELKPENIVFEVVETDEVENLDHLKNILRYYKEHGFKFALDDVGTGYNKISLLSELKPDIVKLAREYVDGVSYDPKFQDTAKRVCTIAKEVGAQPLAEGIENQEDLEYLSNLGYELFQGYYFSKPVKEPIYEEKQLAYQR